MADCLSLEELNNILDIKLRKKKVAGPETKNKDLWFDTHEITPDIYYDLHSEEESDGKTAFSKIMKATGNDSNIVARLQGILPFIQQKGTNPLFADLIKDGLTAEQKYEAGRRMQIRGLVMRQIMKTISSEADVEAKKNNLKDNGKLSVDGSRNVPTQTMATALGRDIAYAMGIKVDGRAEYINGVYNQIGTNAIQEIADMENSPITFVDNGSMLNNDIKKGFSQNASKNSQKF